MFAPWDKSDTREVVKAAAVAAATALATKLAEWGAEELVERPGRSASGGGASNGKEQGDEAENGS